MRRDPLQEENDEDFEVDDDEEADEAFEVSDSISPLKNSVSNLNKFRTSNLRKKRVVQKTILIPSSMQKEFFSHNKY